MWENVLTRLLGIEYPIIQAPMAGGVTTSQLVAAVSNAGGLGMIGAGYMTPEQLREQIRELKSLAEKNFGVNLFVPESYVVDKEKIAAANNFLQPVLQELDVVEERKLPSFEQDLKKFHEHVKVVIEEKVPVCSFTFGVPAPDIMARLKEHSIIVIGTATTVEEAMINERAGMDAVVVQGVEAGGHRGSFHDEDKQSLIGLMSLIPQTADRLRVPIIAAGGIMDGRGLMAAKCLGAQGVQMGTAFLVCEESGANQIHKDAIIQGTEDKTVLTKAFSGKMARGLKNRFTEKMKEVEEDLPAYPLQNELTKAIRKASATKGTQEYMSLWAGQSPRLAQQLTARQLIEKILHEAEKIQ
jgi:nitronate monooxygenase